MVMSRGIRLSRTDRAAAMPAAWPMPIAVAVTRLDARASEVAEWQRPATRRLSQFLGSKVR